MIVWTPIAASEKALVKGQIGKTLAIAPEYSAAVVGTSVVLRVHGGMPGQGMSGQGMAMTAIPFASAADAAGWIDANRLVVQDIDPLATVAAIAPAPRPRERGRSGEPTTAELHFLPDGARGRLSLRRFIEAMRERKAQLGLEPRRVIRQRDDGAMQASDSRN